MISRSNGCSFSHLAQHPAINVLFVFAGMMALAWSMRQSSVWKQYGRYTMSSAFVMHVLGLAMIPLLNTHYTGLGEHLGLMTST